MSIGRRLARLVRAERRVRPDDPVRAVEAAHARQEELVDAARRSVADVAVHRRRTEILAERAAAEAGRAADLAAAAVAAGDDGAAREYLRSSLAAEERHRTLQDRYAALDAQVRELERTLGGLESRTEQAARHLDDLRADHDAARASLGMRDAAAVAGRRAADAALAADRAEDEIRRLRARAVGHAELAWSDPGSAQVREAFDRLETGLAAERELERLKERRSIEGG